MIEKTKRSQIGSYRPLSLWGGAGAIRMSRLKFMNQAVDEAAHLEAHKESGARRIAGEMYCNWAHLAFDWGFPPEVEQGDRQDFGRAVEMYHQAGCKVTANIQVSNCVFTGSYRSKDWYALDLHGQRIPYFSGRCLTCLTHAEWMQRLKDTVRLALESGADGLFFDNLWFGMQPIALSGAWLGAAGCHCPRCKLLYREASGRLIPTTLQPGEAATEEYLRWRADQVTRALTSLVAYAKEIKPGVLTSSTDTDIVMRPATLCFGQDSFALSRTKDIVMIESNAVPRWEPAGGQRLPNNALTLRMAHALVDDKAHLNLLAHGGSNGVNAMHSASDFLRSIAEAAACSASLTIQGSEYLHRGKYTTLISSEFAPEQRAIGHVLRWLESNIHLYEGRRNVAPVGLLFPGERLWQNWHRLAPLFFGAGQTLLKAGIPWRVVASHRDVLGLESLLVLEPGIQELPTVPEGVRVVALPALEGWSAPPETTLSRHARLRGMAGSLAYGVQNAYYSSKTARRLLDSLGMPRRMNQSALFDLPPAAAQQALLAALPRMLYPRLEAPQPVLIEVWQQGEILQVHLVNYVSEPQQVVVKFGTPLRGWAISPDGEAGQDFFGTEIKLEVEIYRILILEVI